MTKDQQAALEQAARAAREWCNTYWYDSTEEDISNLTALLAAQRAAGLEEARKELHRLVSGGGYYGPIFALDTWLEKQAQEQRP